MRRRSLPRAISATWSTSSRRPRATPRSACSTASDHALLFESERISFEQSLSSDGLHMNDWSYACTAKLLANALLDGIKAPAATAAAPAVIKTR